MGRMRYMTVIINQCEQFIQKKIEFIVKLRIEILFVEFSIVKRNTL